MAEKILTNVNEKNLILNRANSAVISRDFSTAARLYKQLLRDEPSNVDYLKQLGSIYVKNSEDEKAIPYYEQIITFYPHYIEAMNSLGAIFRRLKRYDESISILERALDEGRQTGEVNYNLGFTYKDMGNYDDAIDAFHIVIAENPSDVLAYNHLASIYLTQKKYEKSIATFKRGLQVDPNHPILNYNLAHCYEESKNYKDAIICYDKALKTRPGWIDAIKDYSALLIKCQKTKEASDLVQRSIQLHPNDKNLLRMLGTIYLDGFDYESAEKAFKRAKAVDSDNIEVLRGLAKALEKEEKTKEAVSTVVEALEIQPENKDIKKQYVHALLSANEFDAAYDNVRNLYKQEGNDDPQVLDLYGQYYVCTKQDEEAKLYYDEIEKNNKQYKDHILSQAERYNQIGDVQKAEKKATEYISKVTKNPVAYHVLGSIYENEGDYKKAYDSYNTSKKIFRPNILAEKKISKLKTILLQQEIPVEEEIIEEETPETENQVEEIKTTEPEVEEDFDFGSMGDNVPMGEALLEKEDDFFEEDPEEAALQAQEEEEEEEIPSTYKKPEYENLEDETLSPFGDLDEEEKSDAEQLVPDADFSENKPKDDEVLDEFGNFKNPSEKTPYTQDKEPTNDLEAYSEPNNQKTPNDSYEHSDDEPYSNEPKNSNPNAQDFEDEFNNSLASDEDPFDFGAYGGQDSTQDSSQDMANDDVQNIPQEASNPQNTNNGLSDKSPYLDEQTPFSTNNDMSNMDKFAQEMQKKMQDALMDSSKYAMDAAMNAQKMANQLAEQQEQLKDKLNQELEKLNAEKQSPNTAPKKEAIPEPIVEEEPSLESEPITEPIVEEEPNLEVEPITEPSLDSVLEPQESSIQDVAPIEEEISEPFADSVFSDSDIADIDPSLEPKPISEQILDSDIEPSLETESFTDQDDSFDIDPNEVDKLDFSEDASFDIEPNEEDKLDHIEDESLELPEEIEFQEENSNIEENLFEQDISDNLDFADFDELTPPDEFLSDLGIDSELEKDQDFETGPMSLMEPSTILPKIEKILSDENYAKDNQEELDLFKKLLTFRDYLNEEEKQEFDQGKIRMLLEFIIQKMSGKPGLLKTAISLIKSGILGSDFVLEENTQELENPSNELVKQVLIIMKKLTSSLEDKDLAIGLCNCADSVLERIELEEKKVELF